MTLTTDFGLRDAYVAEMKGVLLGLAPHARLVDVTHEVESHDVVGAALTLEAAAPFFPRGTIHLAVVDPGVGTDRRAMIVTTAEATFVAPDNGLLTPFLRGDGWSAFEIASPDLRLPHVSRTFHGRDVFAPAAGHLACGVPPDRFGPRIDDPVRLAWPEVRALADAAAGAVLHVDRFGNLITSIDADTVARLGHEAVVRIAGRRLPIVGTYADLAPGDAGGVIGSGQRLEVAVREGSAAVVLGARRGTPVAVSRMTTRTSRPKPVSRKKTRRR